MPLTRAYSLISVSSGQYNDTRYEHSQPNNANRTQQDPTGHPPDGVAGPYIHLVLVHPGPAGLVEDAVILVEFTGAEVARDALAEV